MPAQEVVDAVGVSSIAPYNTRRVHNTVAWVVRGCQSTNKLFIQSSNGVVIPVAHRGVAQVVTVTRWVRHCEDKHQMNVPGAGPLREIGHRRKDSV